jgi:ribosomal-protein-alanine N-acetyltransferase
MTMADIPRVVEIERLAYPSTWPPSAYRKELQDNPLAHYVVVRDTRIQAPAAPSSPADSGKRPFPLSLLPARPATPANAQVASIVGFAGLWLMVDEAHITTIATHPDYRGRGLGELLLSSLIDIAYRIGARNVTLEARVSNYVAQNLYHKYGFREAGIRRRYYSDNHEDAVIMWTEDINSDGYRQRFAQLKAALAAKLAAQDGEVGTTGRAANGDD